MTAELTTELTVSRSSSLQMFFKLGVLKNLAKFTGKPQCCTIFLIMFQAFKHAILLKGDSSQAFFCKFCQTFKNTFLTEHLWWLLLCLLPGYSLRVDRKVSCRVPPTFIIILSFLSPCLWLTRFRSWWSLISGECDS